MKIAPRQKFACKDPLAESLHETPSPSQRFFAPKNPSLLHLDIFKTPRGSFSGNFPRKILNPPTPILDKKCALIRDSNIILFCYKTKTGTSF